MPPHSGTSLTCFTVLGILVTIAFVTVGTIVIGLVLKAVCKGSLAVDPKAQSRGLDMFIHGEQAYPSFDGLD